MNQLKHVYALELRTPQATRFWEWTRILRKNTRMAINSNRTVAQLAETKEEQASTEI